MNILVWMSRSAVALMLAFTAISSLVPLEPAQADDPQTTVYRTRGVIKSFDAQRHTVMIAHEAIEGFMGAMTMSFESKSSDQLQGLAVNDRVRFSFAVTADGRRIIESIAKSR